MDQSRERGYGAQYVHSHTWPGMWDSDLMKMLKQKKRVVGQNYLPETDVIFLSWILKGRTYVKAEQKHLT